jgi:hypothetical protein
MSIRYFNYSRQDIDTVAMTFFRSYDISILFSFFV